MKYFSDLLDKVLYMFRTGPLSIIRSISTLYTRNRPLGVSSPLCILELSRLTRVEYGSQKHNYIVIYRVLVYIQISANYMFRPLLVRPSSGRIPSPRKYIIVLYNHWSQGTTTTRSGLQKWGTCTSYSYKYMYCLY